MTLGEQLAEVQSALTPARKAILTKSGDKEVQRSYNMLLQEQTELRKLIALHGSNYSDTQTFTPSKARYGVSFG